VGWSVPSVELSSASCIATRSGWLPITGLPADNKVLGLDRFGTLTERVVTVDVGSDELVSFVGSQGAFGAFASGTRILESTGPVSRVDDLVEEGGVRSRIYEVAVQSVWHAFDHPVELGVWSGLKELSCSDTNDCLVVRCVENAARVPRGVEQHSRGGIRYLVLSQRTVAGAFAKDWRVMMQALARALFLRSDEGRLEIPVRASILGLWYASALSATGSGFQFAYDSIQHSSYLYVYDAINVSTGVSAGSTAFRKTNALPMVDLKWSDSSWSPIVNGFITAGR